METRTCRKCGVVKEVECFASDKGRKDGLCMWCKECQKEGRTRWQSRVDRRKPKEFMPEAQPGLKYCGKCKTHKEPGCYGKWTYGKDGLQKWCKQCTNDYARQKMKDPVYAARVKRRSLERYHNHPEGNAAHLKATFGITVEKYLEMVRSQDGLCAICRLPPKGKKLRLGVDHNHATGQIRGLLCTNCNTAIGKLAESTERMQSAISYLNRHQGEFAPLTFLG